MTELKNKTAPPSNDIALDADGLADKRKIINEQRANARLYSTAETFQFLAAALLPVGLATVIATATKGAAVVASVTATTEAATGAITLGAIASAFTAPTAIVLLGAAAICTTIAIASRYMASKHFHNANFNSTEMNSKHTAKYIAKELKTQAACVQSEYPENVRADGRKWTQAVQQQESHKTFSLVRR